MKHYLLFIFIIISGNFNGNSQTKKPADFIPEGYVLFEDYYGDLNNDGQEDCVLIFKGTNKKNIVINRYDKKVDRNRRGIIVLFNKNEDYKRVAINKNCFFSENEDGGVYFPPELWIKVEKGNLILNYGHGRYGYWRYIFRYQDSNFELIGYDSSSSNGSVINSEKSINFLTKKKLIRENTNENAKSGEEVFKETWSIIKVTELLKLSEIKSFYELDMSTY